MSLSDKINATLSILSFLLAAISIVSVVITLRQNNKMIENATRPYITIKYETVILPNELARYIVVKNYGQTGATITEMNCSGDMNPDFMKQIKKIKGSTLAPSQRLLYYFGKPNPGNVETVTFDYTYMANKKEYQESVTLQLTSGTVMRRSKSEETLDPIAYALEEITERLI